MLCPCGSDNNFDVCCELIISGKEKARSPEKLMRSRYSAYATNNAEYIFNTYALSSKKSQTLADISSWAKETTWLKLTIINSSTFNKVEYPTVTFEATYKSDNTFYMMKETSRFVTEQGFWKYLDGNHLEHTELTLPKRNDPCICASDRKFKKCCG